MILSAGLLLTACQGLPSSREDASPDTRPTGSSLRLSAQEQLDQAQRYLQQKLPDSALGSYVLALEENPRLVEAHLGMGDIYRNRGDWTKARAAYQRASDIDPDRSDMLERLGQCDLAQGNWDAAAKRYLLALAHDPQLWQANRDLATLYLRQNRPGEAMPYIQKAASIRSDDPIVQSNLAACYLATGQWVQAEKTYRRAIEQSPQAPALKLGLAQTLIQLRRYTEAVAILNPLTEKWPTARVQERLASALAAQDQHAPAIIHYRAALNIEGNDLLSLNGLGLSLWNLYLAEGRGDTTLKQQAIQAFERSLILNPQQPEIQQKLTAAQSDAAAKKP